MKNNISKVIIAILVIVFIIFLIRLCCNSHIRTNGPQKPNKVPETAKWIGGFDGGAWFEIVNIDTNKMIYRFRIYDDRKGDLIEDADFITDKCNVRYALSDSIINNINYYDCNHTIVMKDHCNLQKIKSYMDK